MDESPKSQPASTPATGFRADWRFLLPPGPYEKLVVVSAEAQQAAFSWLVDDGWVDQLTIVRPSEGSLAEDCQNPEADVLIVDDPGLVDASVSLLAPGGWLCLLSRPTPRLQTLRGGQARLDRRGDLVGVRRYLALPSLTNPKRLVPIGHRYGLQWLTSPQQQQVQERLPKPIGSLVGPLLKGLTTNKITKAGIVRVASGGFRTCMIAVGQKPPASTESLDRPEVIVVSSGFDEGSRAVVYWLDDDGPPTRVTKFASRPRYNSNADQERAALQRISSLIGPTESDALLPQLQGVSTVAGLRATTETYLGRRSVSDALFQQPNRRHELLDRSNETMSKLALACTTETVTWNANLFDRYLGSLGEKLIGEISADAAVASLLSTAARRSSDLEGLPVRLGPRHYDLGPWNIMLRDDSPDSTGSMTIIDWELAPPRSLDQNGLLGSDFVYFTKYWMHAAESTESIDDEQNAFAFFGSPSGLQAKTAIKHHLELLGLDTGFVPLLTIHIWLETALYTLARRQHNQNDPGSAMRYLETLAANNETFFEFWPTDRR